MFNLKKLEFPATQKNNRICILRENYTMEKALNFLKCEKTYNML